MKTCRHIAIVGGSGSGKTWLAERLCAELGESATRLSLDDFYRDLSDLPVAERECVNFDDPAAIEWAAARAVISSLKRGETAHVPVYDFATHTRRHEARRLVPCPFIIWDGLWLLHDTALRKEFSFSVFVDCDSSERLRRRIARDRKERGRAPQSVKKQFLDQVQPMHKRFVEPQKVLAFKRLTSPITEADVRKMVRFLLNLGGFA